MQALPPVLKGFYWKTTPAHRSVRGNEHLDFTTCMTPSAEPHSPKPCSNLNSRKTKPLHKPTERRIFLLKR